MAYYYSEPSHTFSEYLLVPGYSDANCIPLNVSLKTPLVKFKRGEESALSMNIPLVSAIMQSVSDDRMAIALAKEGGISFIYGSQTIEKQAEMVRRVKGYKAGFVTSDSNIRPDGTLADVIALKEALGHSTIAVTDDGTSHGRLLGVVTSRDYRISRMSPDDKVSTFMTPFEKLITAPEGTSLKEANDIIWEHKLNSLPIIDGDGRLVAFVFRKDYDQHKENPHELLDAHKRYVVGAGINTRDYAERVPALVEAGADVLCIDSSEGYTEWQSRTLAFIREKYGDTVKVGAGNVVDAMDSVSSRKPARTLSRSALAAALSVSQEKQKGSDAVRRRLSLRWPKRATNILRKPGFMCRSARTAASFSIIISRWRLLWAVISVCSAGIFPL